MKTQQTMNYKIKSIKNRSKERWDNIVLQVKKGNRNISIKLDVFSINGKVHFWEGATYRDRIKVENLYNRDFLAMDSINKILNSLITIQ